MAKLILKAKLNCVIEKLKKYHLMSFLKAKDDQETNFSKK